MEVLASVMSSGTSSSFLLQALFSFSWVNYSPSLSPSGCVSTVSGMVSVSYVFFMFHSNFMASFIAIFCFFAVFFFSFSVLWI